MDNWSQLVQSERIKELELKVINLKTLLNAFTEISADIELPIVLEKALNLMCYVVKAEAGSLWLLNETQDRIHAMVANGPSAKKILTITLSPGAGIVGKVIATGQSEWLKDVAKDKNWAKWVDQETGFVTRSMLAVPLKTKDAVIGAMQLINKKGEQLFNEEDLHLAEALAHHSALAIQNSRLFDNLKRLIEERGW